MKTLIMKGCAKDRIEDIKTIKATQQKEEKNVLIVSKLFRYGC